ncbi:T9SS type A sorting domain-containing protein [Flavobacterium suzhouense]|uniref:T9SS type A sorting domain-containing protein n=1 Tax=Flavobacterium suzhouense TaxID=1529638 RepID=A0ABW5NZ06_9FLAO
MRNLYYCFLVLLLSLGAHAQCIVNGSFETTPTQYSFTNRSSGLFQVTDCEVNTADPVFNTFTLPTGLNQLTADASWVSSGNDSFLLACNPSVTVNRVKPGSGSRALRLNNFKPYSDITTMSQTFTATGTEISFSYSLIIENPHPDEMDRQPFFSVRVYDSAGNIISNHFCLVADPNNVIFDVTSWFNPDENENQEVLYTGWQCGLITIPDEYLNQSVRLEFVIGDCGKNAHFGTVYIDDISCTAACTQPAFGYLALDDASFNCPKEPFQVCGSYILPEGTTLTSNFMQLQIWKDGVYIGTVLGASSLTSDKFCFTVDPATHFGPSPSGEYEFKLIAYFYMSATSYYLKLTDSSTSVGPDVTIGNVDITGAYVQASTLIWPDVADVYELEFFTDGSCCPESPATQPAYFHFTQTENTFDLTQIASTIPGGRAMVYGCFRYRIKTDCGWSAWCCITMQNGHYEFPEGANWGNPIAPDCYEGAAGSCLSTLTLTVSDPVVTNTLSYQQRDQWIKASNRVEQDAIAIYQAGNFIELQPGFNAQYTSVFQASIENCVYGAAAPQPKPQAKVQDLSGEDNKDVSKKGNSFMIYPNPFIDTITIVDKNIFSSVNVFTVIDITGKEVIRVNNPEGLKEHQINVSSLNSGVYFVLGDGETLQKIIKN